MNIFIDILKTIVPAIISGVFTFIITKYSYNRKVPLDKMEIAYNRVYYPIYRIIYDNKKFNKMKIDTTIHTISFYLSKYNKYVDKSTISAFNTLCKYKDKQSYKNFINNVYDKNSYLRRRLGYLEPNFIQIYKYLSESEKSTLRINIEVLIIYVCAITINIVQSEFQIVLSCIFIIIILVIIIEIIVKLIRFVCSKIRMLKNK